MSQENTRTAAVVTDDASPEDPYDFSYQAAVFFLAGHYAAEEVRQQQIWAVSRGSNLSKEEIARIFREAAESMAARIERTSD
jgi:hypothetical protein